MPLLSKRGPIVFGSLVRLIILIIENITVSSKGHSESKLLTNSRNGLTSLLSMQLSKLRDILGQPFPALQSCRFGLENLGPPQKSNDYQYFKLILNNKDKKQNKKFTQISNCSLGRHRNPDRIFTVSNLVQIQKGAHDGIQFPQSVSPSDFIQGHIYTKSLKHLISKDVTIQLLQE